MNRSIPNIVLTATLLLMGATGWAQQIGSPEWEKAQPPMKEIKKVSNLKVIQKEDGRWFATFDLDFMTLPKYGEVDAVAHTVSIPGESDLPLNLMPRPRAISIQVQHDTKHMELELEFPQWVKNPGDRGGVSTAWQNGTKTNRVSVRLFRRSVGRDGVEVAVVLADQVVEQEINWPSSAIWSVDRRIVDEGPQAILKLAVQKIDIGDDRFVGEAKVLLERLLARDSTLVPAYIELARVAMRTPGGTEGFHHAEALLNTATKIDPNNANVQILRGHVYTMQRRHALAEAEYTKAAATNPKNLWLWTNWGQSLAMQGKDGAALKMYRKAIDGPLSQESHDRARVAAYEQMVVLYEKQHDLQALDSIHQQRLSDYGLKTCYAADYALFKLANYADADSAIELTRGITSASCSHSEPKDVLGMAYYVKWAQMKTGDRESALQTARLSFPTGARLFYMLGANEKTVDTAKQLVNIGELIDQSDNKKMTALAYAVQTGDTNTAGRLLQLGARPTATVGYDAMPVALLPLFTNDLATIALMKKFGVNYGTLKFQGKTALDYARASGNNKLINALGQKTPKT